MKSKNIDVFQNEDGTREFKNDKPVKLIHQEHKIITIPAEEWISDVDNEFDPFEEEIRRVKD